MSEEPLDFTRAGTRKKYAPQIAAKFRAIRNAPIFGKAIVKHHVERLDHNVRERNHCDGVAALDQVVPHFIGHAQNVRTNARLRTGKIRRYEYHPSDVRGKVFADFLQVTVDLRVLAK